jgi:hypothetical protein
MAGFNAVTEEPDHQVEFIVEGELPHGIDQETVDAAAEGVALSYAPFTIRVVERELEWDETYHGDIGDEDMLLSVGRDPDDLDLTLEDPNRVAFSGEESAGENYAASTEIRGVFNNNLTLGHGPSAVVGAALTAAGVKFDDGMRSPAIWGSLAALPMLGAILATHLWLRDRSNERRLVRRLSRSQLALARVVLELDALEIRLSAARLALDRADADGAREAITPLEADWEAIRKESLSLARTEDALRGVIADRAPLDEGKTFDDAVAELQTFEKRTEKLTQRADALSGATELRAGHAGSRSVLNQLALPLAQSITEVLREGRRFDAAAELRQLRDTLLALTQEAAAADPAGASAQEGDLVADHADLLRRWSQAEKEIVDAADRMSRQLGPSRSAQNRDSTLAKATQQRADSRVLTMTAGATSSVDRLRISLGLGAEDESGPLHATERVLVLLDREAESRAAAQPQPDRVRGAWEISGALGPLVIGLLAGWLAASQADVNTAYGKTLTGDQPLADLRVFGDPQLLPEISPEEDQPSPDAATQEESLDLGFVRDQMERSTQNSADRALLPDDLDLVVAIVPATDYFEYREHPEFEGRLEIDYLDLIDAQRQLIDDVAETYPEVRDPDTGEIVRGQGVLPIWSLPGDQFAPGATLTGEISSGPDSRLGRYYFQATEPRIQPDEDFQRSLGEIIAYDLTGLAMAMEYNHQESANVAPSAVFWMVSVTVWAGGQTVLLLVVAASAAWRRRAGSAAARRSLRGLQQQLDHLALGLDVSRIDMVAVIGSDSPTEGQAEEAAQRLYEATLVTAFREIRELTSLPRREQQGEEWEARVERTQKLVDMLASRELAVADRADAVLRLHREVG